MMKTTIIKNIGCGLLLLGTTACADYLDKESFDIITPEQVWQDLHPDQRLRAFRKRDCRVL